MKQSKIVPLGDYIEYCDERNTDKLYGVDSVRGISIEKKMIFTKANMEGVSVASYKIVKPGEIAFVPDTSRRGDKMSLGYNESDETFIVSSAYEVFRVKDKNDVLPDYLYLFFSRPEFDRYARFKSWGSARESFSWDEMCSVEIPIPPIEEQQKVVNAWKALREIKEQNESIATPLMQMCQSYIQELKHEYEAIEIGEYIEETNERNSEGIYGVSSVRGLATSKGMIDTKANMEGVSVTSYKIVKPGEIAFVPDTSRRGDKMSLGYNELDESVLVSSISCVIRCISQNKLIPQFLYLWFCRSEFDRYARFNSWGSARESFSFADMCRVKIPIPPVEKQQAIVNIYNCANEAKKIAAEADRMSREVCPALIQHIIHN